MLLNDHAEDQNARRLALILRELLAGERFETLADLTDAVKRRCSRLRLPCTPDLVNAAYRLVGSNRPLVGERRPPTSIVEPAAPLSATQARAALQAIRARLGPLPVRTMTAAPVDEVRRC